MHGLPPSPLSSSPSPSMGADCFEHQPRGRPAGHAGGAGGAGAIHSPVQAGGRGHEGPRHTPHRVSASLARLQVSRRVPVVCPGYAAVISCAGEPPRSCGTSLVCLSGMSLLFSYLAGTWRGVIPCYSLHHPLSVAGSGASSMRRKWSSTLSCESCGPCTRRQFPLTVQGMQCSFQWGELDYRSHCTGSHVRAMCIVASNLQKLPN